ncbi:MAG: OmpA family protein [Ignavibacteriaceae bacterium]
MKLLLTILVGFALYQPLWAQDAFISKDHMFSGNWVFSLEGGIALGLTDYKQTKSGYSTKLSLDYFFQTDSPSSFAIRLFGTMQKISGQDDRTTVSAKDSVREIISPFSTDIKSVGIAFSYNYSIDDVIFPFLMAGLSNLWFDPKDNEGNPLFGNETGLYEKNTIAYDFDLGIKYLVSDFVSLNLSAGAHFSLTDYLDDVAASKSNDFHFTVLAGISFSPFVNVDNDDDGIKNSDDVCPDVPEDIDGFEDEDGCPDLDNDNDGILDADDFCINELEDFDGFEDLDGCPDLDNDKDGIPDISDLCPDNPEDFDGFEDEDGCPDLDNDNDGIPDEFDDCPNIAENINGIDDKDGCPDSAFNSRPTELIFKADEIFSSNSSKIKFEAKEKLDEVTAILREYPNLKWRIEGHMDSHGSERFIRTLSLERAKAVLEYLVVFGGLNRANFEVYGLGDKFPIADNKTEQGRGRNRRIEIISEE